MPTNAPARQLRIIISDQDGSNVEDWSNAYSRVELQGGSFATGGIDIKSGSITLLSVRGKPSINPRENPVSFRPGRLVTVSYLGSDRATWKPLWLGKQYIRLEPAPPTLEAGEPLQITIELTSVMGYHSGFSIPDSEGEVTSATASGSVIIALLQTGQIPPAFIGINAGDFPYSLAKPLQKSGGNYIEQAGEIAAANHRYLFEDTNGVIRSGQLLTNPATPAFSLTLGSGLIDKQPAQLDSEPPDIAIAYASIEGVAGAAAAPITSTTTSSELVGNLATVDPSLGGTGAIEKTIETVSYAYTPGQSIGAIETKTQEKLRLSVMISPKLSPKGQRITAEDITSNKYYDEKLRLYRETEVIRMPSVAIYPGATTGLTLPRTAVDRDIRYTYDADGVVEKIWTVEKRSKALINSDEKADPYTPVVAEQRVQTWKEPRPGSWSYSESLSRTLIDVNPAEAERTKTPYKPAAVISPNSVPGYSPAPRAEEFSVPQPEGATDSRIEGRATFTHPGGPLNRQRTEEYAVSPGVSVPQLSQIAQDYGAIMWGRNKGAILEMPLSDIVLDSITSPLTPIAIVDSISTPGTVKTSVFLVDSFTLSFDSADPSNNVAGCAGIWVRDETTAGVQSPFVTYRTTSTTGTVQPPFVRVGGSATALNTISGQIPETIDTTARVLIGSLQVN